jgi:hypothetical protein
MARINVLRPGNDNLCRIHGLKREYMDTINPELSLTKESEIFMSQRTWFIWRITTNTRSIKQRVLKVMLPDTQFVTISKLLYHPHRPKSAMVVLKPIIFAVTHV